jgi:hypothetical protein
MCNPLKYPPLILNSKMENKKREKEGLGLWLKLKLKLMLNLLSDVEPTSLFWSTVLYKQ